MTYSILYTVYNPNSRSRSMTLYREGEQLDPSSHLRFSHFNLKNLAKTGDLAELRKMCKSADFIYHLGNSFSKALVEAGGNKTLAKRVNKMIFEEFPKKSVYIANTDEHTISPSRKDVQYQSVREDKMVDIIPLVETKSYTEIYEIFRNGGKIELPLVFKNPSLDNGKGCYLIETQEQLEILFHKELQKNARMQGFAEDQDFQGKLEACFFQKYIPGFEGDKGVANARVLVHATAKKIIGMTLIHGLKPEQTLVDNTEKKKFSTIFSNPNSPMYLNARRVKPVRFRENKIAIYPYTNLSKKRTIRDQEIMEMHHIPGNTTEMPKSLAMSALAFAGVMRKRGMGGLIGIDFIYDQNDRTWRLLEGNFPASSSFGVLFGGNDHVGPVAIRVKKIIETWKEHAKERYGYECKVLQGNNPIKILFTAYKDPGSYDFSLTQRTYMRIFKEGSQSGDKLLTFSSISLKKLSESKKPEEILNQIRKACNSADFIYHYGPFFETQLINNGGKKWQAKEVHKIIFEEFKQKSVCRNEKVYEEGNPDNKTFQYRAIQEENREDDVPLIPSISFTEMRNQFASGQEIQYPLVFKEPGIDNGWGCFLIEGPEQMKKILNDDLYADAASGDIKLREYFLAKREGCFFQKYIPCVLGENMVANARVLLHATARKILGMTLIYSDKPTDSVEVPKFDPSGFVSLYSNPKSPLYLNAKKVKATDSRRKIAVFPYTSVSRKRGEMDKKVLDAHHIHSDTEQMPKEVEKVALAFGDIMGKRGMCGLIGIDLIFDPETRNWRLLEGNFPASGSFKILYGGRSAITQRVNKVLETWKEYAKNRHHLDCANV